MVGRLMVTDNKRVTEVTVTEVTDNKGDGQAALTDDNQR